MQPPAPFIAMEYLPGGSVQDLLSREKKLSPERALAVILDAARGLEYAEKKSIVHRDIKPDNLMISEDGRIKIGDLGLAKQLKTDGSRPESPEGVFGTPHYIAPEQALNKPIDIRADIYALGTTFYRILAGVTPYQGSSAKEIVVNKLREEPPPLDVVDPGLPKVLTAIVDKMMKRDPAERHLTAKELVAELDRARREFAGSMTGPLTLHVDPAGASSSATATAMGSEARRSATPVVVLTGAAAMLIITVAVVAATLIKNNNADPGPPGPGPGQVDNSNDQAKLEELANKALGNAEMIEKSADLGRPDSIQRVIESYAQIVKEYPGTAAEEKAKSQVDFYQKLLTTLAGDAVFGIAEKKEMAFTAARKAFGQEKTKFEDVVRQAEEAMAAFGDFISKFAEDKRVEEARKRSSVIDGELTTFRGRHLAWSAEAKAINEILDRKSYGEAEGRIAAADRSADFKDYTGAVKALREKLRRDVEREFATLSGLAEQKKRENDFDGARRHVEAGRAWGYSDLKKRWDDVADAIDRAESDYKGAEAKKVREEQLAALREARVRAIDAYRNRYGFAGAASAIEAVLPKLKDPDLLTEATTLLSDYKAAAALHLNFITRSNEGRLKPKTDIAFEKIHMHGELSKCNATDVSIKEKESGATVSVGWNSVKNTEYRMVMRTWDHEWEDARGLVAADIAIGLLKEAETDISSAEKLAAGGHKAELASMRARLTWAVGWALEQEAQDRQEQAREEMKREKWQKALDDLNELATRLNSSKYYAEHRASIDAMQEECKDKMKK
jgi:hypothetical protein